MLMIVHRGKLCRLKEQFLDEKDKKLDFTFWILNGFFKLSFQFTNYFQKNLEIFKKF